MLLHIPEMWYASQQGCVHLWFVYLSMEVSRVDMIYHELYLGPGDGEGETFGYFFWINVPSINGFYLLWQICGLVVTCLRAE